MNLHPDPLYQPIPVKAVIPNSLGYELKEAEIKPTWQMARVLTGQEKKKHFGLIRLNPEKPSPTILRGTGGTTTGLIHPWCLRRLTIAEIKALASFPEKFQIKGRYSDKWAWIGNSVPPLFIKAIARHIRFNLANCR
jgi:site-specific DNA-cytosine methylase